jgi:ABC-type polysaccharide/polyol phosphate transport system ATPase subunit
MSDTVIKVERVGKKFSKSLKRSMFYGAADIVQAGLGMMPDASVLRRDEFWAVDDVSFELNRGERLGIIGANGSGKTTILKMLNGIFMPDKGAIGIEGKIGALIQVGAGFHPMLSGRENVYINGAILGMSKKEINRKFDAMIDFADIGDFLDSPVKHYSSGMYVRLGFAIAVHCDPDILLVDEILAVGDARFYSKCIAKINELTAQKTTIVLVSHNMWLIQTMCDRVLLFDHGKIAKSGDPSECIFEYSKIGLADEFKSDYGREDERPVVIRNLEIRENNNIVEKVSPDASLEVITKYSCQKDMLKGQFLLRVTTPDGYPLYTSYSERIDFQKGDGIIKAKIPSVSLLNGEYRLWVGVFEGLEGIEEKQGFHAMQRKLVVRFVPSMGHSKFGIFLNKIIWDYSII